MSDVLNPVEVEQTLLTIANDIARGVMVVSNAHAAYLQADRAYDLAFAKAYGLHDGPQGDKKYAATVATENERTARDVADAAYQHARRTEHALRDRLSAYQSVGRSVMSMYSTAGRGE